jgi:shikimate kinase
MHSKKNLVFLGMMGSGKSSIGFLVSKKLNLKFIDIDNLIEDEIGIKISDIFKQKGEDFFRNLEEKITLKVLKQNNYVISLGGGAFINDKIRKEVLVNHFSFWLNWDSDILLKRIKNSQKRPLIINSTDQEI